MAFSTYQEVKVFHGIEILSNPRTSIIQHRFALRMDADGFVTYISQDKFRHLPDIDKARVNCCSLFGDSYRYSVDLSLVQVAAIEAIEGRPGVLQGFMRTMKQRHSKRTTVVAIRKFTADRSSRISVAHRFASFLDDLSKRRQDRFCTPAVLVSESWHPPTYPGVWEQCSGVVCTINGAEVKSFKHPCLSDRLARQGFSIAKLRDLGGPIKTNEQHIAARHVEDAACLIQRSSKGRRNVFKDGFSVGNDDSRDFKKGANANPFSTRRLLVAYLQGNDSIHKDLLGYREWLADKINPILCNGHPTLTNKKVLDALVDAAWFKYGPKGTAERNKIISQEGVVGDVDTLFAVQNQMRTVEHGYTHVNEALCKLNADNVLGVYCNMSAEQGILDAYNMWIVLCKHKNVGKRDALPPVYTYKAQDMKGSEPVGLQKVDCPQQFFCSKVQGTNPLVLVEELGYLEPFPASRDEMLNATDRYGRTALILAAMKGRTDVVRLLLRAGANVNHAGANGETALLWAASNGDTELVKVLLGERGVNVDGYSNKGNTALIVAAMKGRAEVVGLLLSAGANVNHAGDNRDTALTWVAKNRCTEVVLALLAAGADVNVKVQNQWLLVWAMQQEDSQLILHCLDGAESYSQEHLDAALACTAQTGRTEVALALLVAGADGDVEVQDQWLLVWAMQPEDSNLILHCLDGVESYSQEHLASALAHAKKNVFTDVVTLLCQHKQQLFTRKLEEECSGDAPLTKAQTDSLNAILRDMDNAQIRTHVLGQVEQEHHQAIIDADKTHIRWSWKATEPFRLLAKACQEAQTRAPKPAECPVAAMKND